MGAYKPPPRGDTTMIEQMEKRSKKDVKISELEQKLYTLETLVERYGLCHPDLQIARLSRKEAMDKYLQEMRDNRVKRVGGEPS